MRHVAQIGLGWLFTAVASCGGAEPSTAGPSPSAPEQADATPAAAEPAADPSAPGGETPAAPTGPRVDLDASFHRTRVGPGGGFWVMGTVANPRADPVGDVRPSVRLLDEDGALLLEVHGRGPALAAGDDAAIVLLVEAPIEHEQLELHATGVETDQPPPPRPQLTLEHDAPARAELGGWHVLGQIRNESGAEPGTVRVEVRALDRSGQLLGVDWFEVPIPAADEGVPFDLGGLRYEDEPRRFELELVGPAPALSLSDPGGL